MEALQLSAPPSSPTRLPAPWPHTFKFGDFVRLIHRRDFWGIIIAPSEHEGRWVFEYPQGARVTNDAKAFELFEPTTLQRRQMEPRLAQLSKTTVTTWGESTLSGM